MRIGVYELYCIECFLFDMSQYKVMEVTLAETVGAMTDQVKILKMEAARRLQDASTLATGQARSLLQTLEHFIVDFRIVTSSIMVGNSSLGARILITLETVSMYAMTFQMQQVMLDQSVSRPYSVVIFNVTVAPIYTDVFDDDDTTTEPNRKPTSGCQSNSPHDFLVILWLCVAIGIHRFACSA